MMYVSYVVDLQLALLQNKTDNPCQFITVGYDGDGSDLASQSGRKARI